MWYQWAEPHTYCTVYITKGLVVGLSASQEPTKGKTFYWHRTVNVKRLVKALSIIQFKLNEVFFLRPSYIMCQSSRHPGRAITIAGLLWEKKDMSLMWCNYKSGTFQERFPLTLPLAFGKRKVIWKWMAFWSRRFPPVMDTAGIGSINLFNASAFVCRAFKAINVIFWAPLSKM